MNFSSTGSSCDYSVGKGSSSSSTWIPLSWELTRRLGTGHKMLNNTFDPISTFTSFRASATRKRAWLTRTVDLFNKWLKTLGNKGHWSSVLALKCQPASGSRMGIISRNVIRKSHPLPAANGVISSIYATQTWAAASSSSPVHHITSLSQSQILTGGGTRSTMIKKEKKSQGQRGSWNQKSISHEAGC